MSADRKRSGKVHRCSSFANATFLIGYSYNLHAKASFSFSRSDFLKSFFLRSRGLLWADMWLSLTSDHIFFLEIPRKFAASPSVSIPFIRAPTVQYVSMCFDASIYVTL